MRRVVFGIFCYVLSVGIAWGQDARLDTLETAYSTAYQVKQSTAGLRSLDAQVSRRVVSVAGEGDVLKLVQTLPGISSGSEGSSAFYVRGGNLGHNAVTLDGVRMYGYSHLMGLTTAFPNTIVEDVKFAVGGFGSQSYNLLASHTAIRTKDGNPRRFEGEGSLSNFILGGYVSTPLIQDTLTLIASARLSPLFVGIRGYRVGMYDAYAKMTWYAGSRHTLRGSVFYSHDSFRYRTDSGHEGMGWGNLIGNLEWTYRSEQGREFLLQVSRNQYQNEQSRDLLMDGVYNELTMYSDLQETVAHACFRSLFGRGWSCQFGARMTELSYKPGSTKVLGSEQDREMQPMLASNVLMNLYGELRYTREEKFHGMVSGRVNYYRNKDRKEELLNYQILNPEVSVSGQYFLAPWLGIEVTYDLLTQYHHTLEGVPLGWSLDLVIPADWRFLPEFSQQGYVGLLSCIGQHSISVGAYYKYLTDLVYFSEPTLFFGSGTTQWLDAIKVGKGTSKGIELLYQKVGKVLNYHLSYTYSRTDRHFPEVNGGVPFYAKYDRPHVLNLTMDYLFLEEADRKMGVNLLFTYQSGNLESVKSAHYDGILPGTDYRVDLDYYEGLNNFRLKDYMRLDVGFYAEYKKPRVTHAFSAGIYNLMNRHNIFSIFYDQTDKVWKSVSLFPIMPSLSYQIRF